MRPSIAVRRPAFSAILLAGCFCFLSPPADAAELEVSAGEPAALGWTVPTNAQCGDPFTAKLEVRDRFGNVVTDADRRGLEFEITVSGRGEIWPKTVSSRSFVRGVAEIQMIYKVAERIELTAQSTAKSGRKLEGRSAPFHVAAGKLAEIRVVSPAAARAGIPFRVTLMALDSFGNQIRDFNARTDGVTLSADGLGRFNPTRIPAANFADGVTEVSATYTGMGEIEIRVKEGKSGVAGKSAAKVTVSAGDPAKFQITAPRTATVDEPFDVAITALDAFGNVVLDYDAIGTMLYLGSDGSTLPAPSEVPAKLFVKGVAFLKLTYPKSENMVLAVSEPGTSRTGASGPIDVQAGRPRRLDVTAPEDIEAGAPFTVKIRSVDSRGNISKNPDAKILLSVLGSVRTAPIEILPTAFQNGSAERKVSYNVAEEIRVAAQDAAGLLTSEPALVRIRPGPASIVEASAPPSVMAGAGIPAVFTAMDAFRNPVFQFDQAVVIARVEGPDAPPALELPASSFSQGKTSTTLPYFRAGTVRVSAELSSGRARRTLSNPIEIVPAALHHFDVNLPAQAQAGVTFRMTLTAKDAYGNTIADYDRTGGGIQIHSSGVGEIQPAQVVPSAFKNGVAQVDLRTYAAERVTLTASERFGTAVGRSGLLKISAGPLSQFMVSAVPKVRAGEIFPIRIEAQDMYYNLIRDLDAPGRIQLMAAGQSKIIPESISAADFTEGVAVVSGSISSAGQTEITVVSEDRRSTGRSNPVQILPATAASYRVDVLDPVIAGEPFRVRVSAVDAFGNPAVDPQSVDRPVRLDVAGAGARANPVTPSSFLPLLFNHGAAEGYLVFPEAGRITIQVKGGAPQSFRESAMSEWRTQVEGMFFKASGDQTDIFVLANGPIDYRAAQPTNFGGGMNALVITLPSASVLRPLDYDALDVPGVRAAKLNSESGGAARLVLRLESSYGYSISARANLLQVSLRSGPAAAPAMLTSPAADRSTAAAIPALDEVQAYVDRGDYRTARRAVELFLSAHPGHPEATAMRARLEKVLRVLGE